MKSKDLDINEEITKLKEEFRKCGENVQISEEAREALQSWTKDVVDWIRNPGPSIARSIFPIEKIKDNDHD